MDYLVLCIGCNKLLATVTKLTNIRSSSQSVRCVSYLSMGTASGYSSAKPVMKCIIWDCVACGRVLY